MVRSSTEDTHKYEVSLARKRQWLFAFLMSLVTVNIVSLAILWMNHVPRALFWTKWISAVSLAWPIVFLSVLWIAPLLTRVVQKIIR